MFYAYKDKHKLQSMISKSKDDSMGRHVMNAKSIENMKMSMENLLKCVAFCINDVQCRRVMLLSYFGETFPAEACKGTCDNCARGGEVVMEDVTSDAKILLALAREIVSAKHGTYPPVRNRSIQRSF